MRHVARIGLKCVSNLGQNVKEKRSLGRPKHRWQNILKLGLKDCKRVALIEASEGRVQHLVPLNTVIDLRYSEGITEQA